MLTDSYDYEEFVTTQIKCPPPKIIAVKRSLKRQPLSLIDQQNFIDDEDDLLSKKDFINDDDSFSSIESKDLIEFEPDEPLIDLSDVTDGENDKVIQDTVHNKNAKNSSTLLSLLDLLEVGSITRTTETERLGSCADDANEDSDPCSLKKSSSSSLMDIPVNDFSACAISSGKTDELSSVFPPLSIEQEKPSLVSFIGHNKVKLSSENRETFESHESIESVANKCENGIIAKVIDSTLQKKFDLKSQCSENSSDCENSISTSINFSYYNSPESDFSCKVEQSVTSEGESSPVNVCKNQEKEENLKNLLFCHNHHSRESSNVSDVKLNECVEELPVKEKKSESLTKKESSDSNNNRESVCNQNSLLSSLTLSHSLLRNLAKLNVDDRAQPEHSSEENSKFLSPHTSQKKFPPNFYSSTNSLNQDVSFEASSRLKRLEERFKGFSYTKKLLRSSKVFSKSEETLSSIGRGEEFKFCEDPLNSSHSSTFPLSSSTLSENCLRQLTDKVAVCNNNNDDEENQFHNQDLTKKKRASSSDDEISGKLT